MNADEIAAVLAAPFRQEEVRFKPQTVAKDGTKALAVAYIDSRTVMDRLDAAVGVGGWQEAYEVLASGSVVCRLALRIGIGGEWVTKEDVGSVSQQPSAGDKLKAAYSDALKRAAVKWGVGRYLSRIPKQWCKFDSHRKQLTETPTLPTWALPAGKPTVRPTEQKPQAAQVEPQKPADDLPRDGTALRLRLLDYQSRLMQAGRCKAGELVNYVDDLAREMGPMHSWDASKIQWGVGVAKRFAESHPAPAANGRAAPAA